jgi:hypothetical protein
MTQYRNDPQRISNFFDQLIAGIGHRGSSFSDLDAITHDKTTDRFLVQEFKHADETFPAGQRCLLAALAVHSSGLFTVWVVVKRPHDLVLFEWPCQVGTPITYAEYRDRFAAWWGGAIGREMAVR